MMLKAYIQTCVQTVVERGAEVSLFPQFGQKYHCGCVGWWQYEQMSGADVAAETGVAGIDCCEALSICHTL